MDRLMEEIKAGYDWLTRQDILAQEGREAQLKYLRDGRKQQDAGGTQWGGQQQKL